MMAVQEVMCGLHHVTSAVSELCMQTSANDIIYFQVGRRPCCNSTIVVTRQLRHCWQGSSPFQSCTAKRSTPLPLFPLTCLVSSPYPAEGHCHNCCCPLRKLAPRSHEINVSKPSICQDHGRPRSMSSRRSCATLSLTM